jgi:hypothetical protein
MERIYSETESLTSLTLWSERERRQMTFATVLMYLGLVGKGGKQAVNRQLSTRAACLILFLLLAIGCLGVFAFQATVSRGWAGNTYQLYYILLLVWALICALVLFLAVHAYAKVVYKDGRLAVELGGPAAVFALVVAGGHWLVPRSEPRDLTIRLHAPGQYSILNGKVQIFFDGASPEVGNDSGGAHFFELPPDLWNRTIQILPKVDGYEQVPQSKRFDAKALDVYLVPDLTTFRGHIVRIRGLEGPATLFIEGGPSVPVEPDDSFHGTIKGSATIPRSLTVCVDHQRVYFEVISNWDEELAITLRPPEKDRPC